MAKKFFKAKPKSTVKIALLQINPTVGDLEGNAKKIAGLAKRVGSQNPDLVVTSELALLGYPPRDLLLYPSFIKKAWQIIQKFAIAKKWNTPILIGTAVINESKIGRPLYNSAVLVKDGKIGQIFYKSLLPTYDVFDEDRYFEPVDTPQILNLKGLKIGISICEDLWNDRDFWDRLRYKYDPIENLSREKVNLIINLSSSPFTIEKQKLREAMIQNACKKYKVPIIYVNQVGANDDLIFDGASTVFDEKGKLVARAKAFEEDLLIVNLTNLGSDPKPKIASKISKQDTFMGPTLTRGVQPLITDYPQRQKSIFRALSLGLRDYMRKCGFNKVLIGLSGGIDSSVVACLAVNAIGIGRRNVTGVLMPSPYTSGENLEDAKELAKNLKIRTLTIPIESLMDQFSKSLSSAFLGLKKDVTEENIQARIRGNILMALSNKYNALLLTTGNKSELTVGYTTLYGDLSGGLAPLGDVLKTQVYQLAKWLNRQQELIPKRIISKAPTAELAPGQKDQDTLPPYEILDKIIHLHIEKQQGADEVIKKGYNRLLVNKVLGMIKKAEYKRRQSPPTLKITSRAFGVGWRMPIAAQKKI